MEIEGKREEKEPENVGKRGNKFLVSRYIDTVGREGGGGGGEGVCGCENWVGR